MREHVIVSLKEVLETKIYRELCKYGNRQPPLSAMGYFLRIIGNTILRLIKNLKNNLIFRAYHEVQQCNVQIDGGISLSVKVSQSSIPTEQQTLISPHLLRPQVLNLFKTVKCKALLVAIGSQPNSAKIFKNNDTNSLFDVKIKNIPNFHSDSLLSDSGYDSTIQGLQQAGVDFNKKITILGDPFSAFACANLLKNGPQIYNDSENDLNLRSNGSSPRCFSQRAPIFDSEDSLSPFIQKRILDHNSTLEPAQPCPVCSEFQLQPVAISQSQQQQHQSTNKFTAVTDHGYGEQLSNRQNLSRNSEFSQLFAYKNNTKIQKEHHSNALTDFTRQIQRQNDQNPTQNTPKPYYQYYNKSQEKKTGLSQVGMSVINKNYLSQSHNSSPISNNSKNNINNSNLLNNGNKITGNGITKNLSQHLPFLPPLHMNEKIERQPLQECLCLGTIKSYDFKTKRNYDNPKQFAQNGFQDLEISIVIIGNKTIQVCQSAGDINQNEFDLRNHKRVLDSDKKVASYQGSSGQDNGQQSLKGDLKGLYLNIKSGGENKIKLIQTTDSQEIAQILNSSVAFINASGYTCREINIRGVHGEIIQIQKDSFGQYKTDSKSRLIGQNQTLTNVFGLSTQFQEKNGKEKFQSIIDALKKLDKLSDSLLGDQEEITKLDHTGQPQQIDYSSANVMSFFKSNEQQPAGIDSLKVQMVKAKIGLHFKGVDSYLFSKSERNRHLKD